MRIARIEYESGTVFAAAEDDGPWVPLPILGIEARDTAEVIQQTDAVRGGLAAGSGTSAIGEPKLACPIVRPSKILAIGLNYLDHIRETGADKPERPIVFAKYPSALTGPHDPIVVDAALTEQADYEVELAVVIGRRTRRVSREEALDAVFGYCVANDVSARDWQRKDSQFSRSKSFDTFCPAGPWITTADRVPDPQALGIRSDVNGERRQDSSTKEMIFPVAELVEFLARGMTLEPGDVILTGTPHGVGFAMDPPVYLKPGDVVGCEIDGLGRIENPVVGPAVVGLSGD
jgi:2-keto-4-pentenoate hydratase/2-oxohepta-3-ene-1,7-dioic acid hydratase in catechol pathway